MRSVRQKLPVKSNLSGERSSARRADVCQIGHRNLGLNLIPIQDTRQTQQGSRRARWATCRGISNAIAILAKISRSQRNVLQHRGSHRFTYPEELDWHFTIGLAHRSLIPVRVDGPQGEKVVSGSCKTERKSRFALGTNPCRIPASLTFRLIESGGEFYSPLWLKSRLP